MEEKKHDLSYFRLYLQNVLRESGDSSSEDDEFLDMRSVAAEIEFEEFRRDGMTVDQAQERAMSVLLDGLE